VVVVRVRVAAFVPLIEVALSLPVVPVGRPESVSETVPLKPLRLFAEIAVVGLSPWTAEPVVEDSFSV
jgi:hypothetical protein